MPSLPRQEFIAKFSDVFCCEFVAVGVRLFFSCLPAARTYLFSRKLSLAIGEARPWPFMAQIHLDPPELGKFDARYRLRSFSARV